MFNLMVIISVILLIITGILVIYGIKNIILKFSIILIGFIVAVGYSAAIVHTSGTPRDWSLQSYYFVSAPSNVEILYFTTSATHFYVLVTDVDSLHLNPIYYIIEITEDNKETISDIVSEFTKLTEEITEKADGSYIEVEDFPEMMEELTIRSIEEIDPGSLSVDAQDGDIPESTEHAYDIQLVTFPPKWYPQ